MDVERKRVYRREWKRNKPYLPKSTSLPLLRLLPENRTVFTCSQCGFTNLLVPMCLWCCWTSIEARQDFETGVKSLRRAARSAPRLFKATVSSGSASRSTATSGLPYVSDSHSKASAVNPVITSPSLATVYCAPGPISSQRTTQSPHPSCSTSARRDNLGRNGGLVKTSSELKAICIGPFGIRSGDKCGPTAKRPTRLRADFIPNRISTNLIQHKGNNSDKVTDHCSTLPFSPSTSTFPPRPTLLKGPLPLVNDSARTFPAANDLTAAPAAGSLGPFRLISSPRTATQESCRSVPSLAASPIRAMQRDAYTFDTRLRTYNASDAGNSIGGQGLSDTATHASRHGYRTNKIAHPFRGSIPLLHGADQNGVQMKIEVTTATPQVPVSHIDQQHCSTATAAEQSSDVDLSAMMEISRDRSPIPSTLLHHVQNDPPTNDPSLSSSHILTSRLSIMTESNDKNISRGTPDATLSPPRTLRRKKRMSAGFVATITASTTANSGPCDPAQKLPSSPQLAPAPPVIITPPTSPSQAEGSFPGIVVNDDSATVTAVDPLMAAQFTTPTPSQPLPRIGTPKRPYFTVVRGSMSARPASGISHLSTPPTSPTSLASPTFGGRRSPSPSRSIDPRYSESTSAVTGSEDKVRSRSPTGYGNADMFSQPVSIPEIATVPSLSSLHSTVAPVPIPIPVQMHMRPSSPVRSILSVLDPGDDRDDDHDHDEDMGYDEVGMSRSRTGRMLRERRSGSFKEKGKGRGDISNGNGYHFPLSLSLSLGRKRGRALGGLVYGSETEREAVPPLPERLASGHPASLGTFSPGRGCSMSGEMEMRMALAERSMNAKGSGGEYSSSEYRFRGNQRTFAPSSGSEARTRSGNGGSRGGKLLKVKSTIGLVSVAPAASSPASPTKPRLGSRLKEMRAHLLGKLQGSETNQS